MTPRVSVCIPAYEAAANLQATLDSVWAQGFEDFELVLVDDGSTDATAAIVAAQRDPRLRAFVHRTNKGQEATVAALIGLARTPLVKFLDADDLLHPDCLGTMVEALDRHPRASFVFSDREILSEDPEDPEVKLWVAALGDLPAAFERIGAVNDGHDLLRQCLRGRLAGNWIAEPAGVMARRADLLAVGGYNRRVRQNNDIDLWVRLMDRGEVLYVQRPLYTYRLDYESGVTGDTERQAGAHPQWLDPLWTAEGLLGIPGFSERPLLLETRRTLLARSVRRLLAALRREPRAFPFYLRDLSAYLAFRARRGLGRAESLYSPIPTPDKV